jgi:hypothetical protein
MYAVKCIPPGVHAERIALGTFGRDLTQLEPLSEEHRSSNQARSSRFWSLGQMRRVIFESI